MNLISLITPNEKAMKRMRNEYDFIADVSCSTDKLIFLYQAIKNRKEIAAHIFNDVFCEFEDTFYRGKPYKNAIANFKKYMKLAKRIKGCGYVQQQSMLFSLKNLTGDKTAPFIIQINHPDIKEIVEGLIEGIKWKERV